MFSRRTIAITAALAALTAGAVVPTALAQDATEDTSEDPTETTREDRRAAHRDELAAALAEELGLDVDTVAAALETVQAEMAEARQTEHLAQLQERLDAAVEAGSMTQEEADALIAAAEAGVFRGLGRFGGRFGPGGPGGPWGHGGRGGWADD